jgi:hypothetical protein
MAVEIRYADHATPLYLQKLALTLPTSSDRSVGIVRSRTKATELKFIVPTESVIGQYLNVGCDQFFLLPFQFTVSLPLHFMQLEKHG